MRTRTRMAWSLVVGSLMLGGYGVADAQTTDSSTTPSTNSAPADLQRLLAKADAVIKKLEANAGTARKALAQARAARDLIKKNCADDKVNRVDNAVGTAKTRRKSLGSAVSAGNRDLAQHESTMIDLQGQRGEQLAGEANSCVGLDAYFTGALSVTTNIDPNIPRQDPSAYPDNSLVIVQPPSCASCTK